MPEPIYVFQCPNCDEFTDGHELICGSCGESVKRSWVEVITDGAPTGSSDTEYARGFVAGQEYAIKLEQKRIIELLEPLAEHYEECYYNGQPCCWAEECSAEIYGYAIKLIKGENK